MHGVSARWNTSPVRHASTLTGHAACSCVRTSTTSQVCPHVEWSMRRRWGMGKVHRTMSCCLPSGMSACPSTPMQVGQHAWGTLLAWRATLHHSTLHAHMLNKPCKLGPLPHPFVWRLRGLPQLGLGSRRKPNGQIRFMDPLLGWVWYMGPHLAWDWFKGHYLAMLGLVNPTGFKSGWWAFVGQVS